MSFLRSKLNQLQHLSDEMISSLISGELTTVQGFRARAHIEKCWRCRSRREAFEKAAMQITEHRNRMAEGIPTNPERRAKLITDLRQRTTERRVPQPLWTRSIFNFQTRIGHQMNPILASTLIVVAGTFLLIWVWQRSLSPVNAAQLMRRAEASDATASLNKPGVIYQKIRITTPRINVERELYRDPRGIRHRRPEAVKTGVEPVLRMLSSVGVSWDTPLSAAAYREWHDQQVLVTDEVRKEDGGLLKLISKVSNNWIQEESLTVRASDFHPVERTIETRSYGTIEIAELNYAALPWTGVNDALFEPLAGSEPLKTHLSPMVPSALPSQVELDSAELSVRLALNKLHADEGEQISVSRSGHAVEVKGVVETEARKRELISQLRQLPHVNAEILSIPELQSVPQSRTTTQSVTMQSVDVQPSPLEKYLATQADREDELSDASQHLLDAALKVRQNADELITIEKRFAALNESDAKKSTLAQLVDSYSERLSAGLDTENSTLRSLGFEDQQPPPPNPTRIDLASEVDRNETLCRELIAGSGETAKSASEIILEIYESTSRIRLAIVALPRSAK